MSHSISTLLTRNLHDVFGENDPARRRAAIDEIFTEDCVFHEPMRRARCPRGDGRLRKALRFVILFSARCVMTFVLYRRKGNPVSGCPFANFNARSTWSSQTQ